MKRFLFCLAACTVVGLGGLSPGLRADEPAKVDKGDAAKELAALNQEWNEAQQAFFKAYGEAKTTDDKQKALKEKRPNAATFAERFLKVAETNPNSPQATQALVWVVSNARGSDAAKKATGKIEDRIAAIKDLDELQSTLAGLPGYGMGDIAPAVAEKAKKNLDHPKAVPVLMWVCSATLYEGGNKDLGKLYNDTVDLLMDRFSDRKELAPLVDYLAQDSDPEWAAKHLRKLLGKASSDDTKANATFALAKLLKNKDEASQPEAEKLFEKAIEQFGKLSGKQQLITQAKNELNDIKLRGIGKPVPDIAGDDLDGKAFKLSDYKGKVVLIDFWGFW
jgi:hypothetical protein